MGIVGVLWMLFSEVWDIEIMRFVLAGGFLLVALLCFIGGIIMAVVARQLEGFNGVSYFDGMWRETGAAAAFSLFLMVWSAAAGVFCFIARIGE